MANYKAWEGYFGFKEDNGSWGTFDDPDKYLYLPQIGIPNVTLEKMDAKSIRGNPMGHVLDVNSGYQFCSGNIEGMAPIVDTDPAFLFLLKHILPDVDLSGAGADKTHTFEYYESLYSTGLSLAIGWGNKEREKVAGARLNSMKLSGMVNDYLKYNFGYVGKYIGRDQTLDTPSITEKASRPRFWETPNVTVYFQFPSGSSLSNFHAWEITYNAAIQTGPAAAGQLGSKDPVQLVLAGDPALSFTGKITRRADMTDGAGANQSLFHDYWSRWGSGSTDVDAKLVIMYEDGAIGATGSNYTFKIEANIIIPPDQKPQMPIADGLYMEDINFEGRFDGTDWFKITTISQATTPTTGTP